MLRQGVRVHLASYLEPKPVCFQLKSDNDDVPSTTTSPSPALAITMGCVCVPRFPRTLTVVRGRYVPGSNMHWSPGTYVAVVWWW
jgi:hypothetical protein